MFPDHDKVRAQEYIYYYPSIYAYLTSPTYGWSSKVGVQDGWFLYVHFPNLTLPQDIPPYGIIIVCMFPAVFIIHEDRIIPFYGRLGWWVEGVRHELVSGGQVRRVRFWGSNFWGWSDRSDRDPTFWGSNFSDATFVTWCSSKIYLLFSNMMSGIFHRWSYMYIGYPIGVINSLLVSPRFLSAITFEMTIQNYLFSKSGYREESPSRK